MTVFNKTNKIIGMGGTPVLPLAFATVPDSFKGNPILRRMADEGRIVINPSEREARTAPEAPPDIPPGSEPAAPQEALTAPEPAASGDVSPDAEAPAPEAREPETTGEAAPKAEDTPPADSPRKRTAKA